MTPSPVARAFLHGAFPRWLVFALFLVAGASRVQAQGYDFTLRAEPDVIPANGISTSSIFVQVPETGEAISSVPIVHFATTAGQIESTAELDGGVARVLLRSSTTPGTAVVTAFVGSSRQAITVEFTESTGMSERYLEIAAPYVAYGANSSIITAAGRSVLDFGDTHIESDTRLDADLYNEHVWAEGNVLIRHGRGAKAHELRGDRLFYDLRKRQGVIRRADTSEGPARQEFVGSNFAPPPQPVVQDAVPSPSTSKGAKPDDKGLVAAGPVPMALPPGSSLPAAAAFAKPPEGAGPVAPNVPAAANAAVTAPVETARVGTAPVGTGPAGAAGAGINPAGDVNGDANVDAKLPAPVNEADDDAGRDNPVVPAVALPVTPEANGGTPANGGQGNATPGNATPFAGPGDETPALPIPIPLSQGLTLGENAGQAEGAPAGSETRATALESQSAEPGDGEAATLAPKEYSPLPVDSGPTPRIVELPPPISNVNSGFWVSATRLLVYPRDKIQFDHATIFFNGGRVYHAARYVLPLDGSYDPTNDAFSFTSLGGVQMKLPYYFQASPRGTGTLYLEHSAGDGFATTDPGFALGLNEQYYVDQAQHGDLQLDQLGRSDWNMNLEHDFTLSPTTSGAFFVDEPQAGNVYTRTSLTREFPNMEVGLEGFYDEPAGGPDNLRGQFFAQMRPREVGKSGWNYTVGANLLAIQNNTETFSQTITNSVGGGITLPGQAIGSSEVISNTVTAPLYGQTLTASLNSPKYRTWRGAGFTASLLSTGFNYSDGDRGFAPGVVLGFTDTLSRKMDYRIDYTYDRSQIGLYGSNSTSFTHSISAAFNDQMTTKLNFTTFGSQSLSDGSLYSSTDLNYSFTSVWHGGLFMDYSRFSGIPDTLDYGWTLGRRVGSRDMSLNYDAVRARVYFAMGNRAF